MMMTLADYSSSSFYISGVLVVVISLFSLCATKTKRFVLPERYSKKAGRFTKIKYIFETMNHANEDVPEQ